MKQIYLTSVFLFLIAFAAQAQKDYRSGYIIQNQDTVHGLIDYRGELRNAQKITFQTNNPTSEVTFLPTDIKGYGYTKEKRHYHSAFVQDSAKTTGTNYFLRVLVNGNATLYYLLDEMQRERYFIEKAGTELTELKRIVYYEINDQTKQKVKKYDNQYLRSLNGFIADCPAIYEHLQKTKFKRESLKSLIIQYNICVDPNAPVFAEEKLKSKFIGGITAGFEHSGLNINSEARLPYVGLDYSKTNTVTGGLSANITLPWLNEKLSAQAELLYTQHKFNGAKVDNSASTGRVYYYNVNFETNQVKLPIQFRYTFPRGTVRPFLNAGIVNSFIFSHKQSIAFSSVYEGNTTEYAPEKVFKSFRNYSQGLVVGAGVRTNVLADKVTTIELRYESTNGFTHLQTVSTKVNSISVLMSLYL